MADLHFIDVGARKGRTVGLLMKDLRPNIQAYLFEPNPHLARRLKEKFKDEIRVFVWEAALTNRNGEGVFYIPDATSESSSLYADKKTSINAPTITVTCTNAVEFIRNLPLGPIVLYSNCEGSEFDFIPAIFEAGLDKRIVFWSVAFHHGDRKIPSMKPKFWEIEREMNKRGIENIVGHFDKGDIKTGLLDKFVRKVLKYVPES